MTRWDALDLEGATPIHRGWSADQKYRVCDQAGQCYLLRLSPQDTEAAKALEFRMMRRMAAQGIPMCQPVDFGRAPQGVYSLQSWIDGVDAEQAVPAMAETRQYAHGLAAGHILSRIHAIPAPEEITPWPVRYARKIQENIEKYHACPQRYDDGGAFLHFVAANRHCIQDRPSSAQHGDFHLGNMMIDRMDTLTIIDFDRAGFGDPWEDFRRIPWCAQKSPAFACGMIDGYFVNGVPPAFWRLLALYIAANALGALSWAQPFGQEEVDVIRRQGMDVLQWYDGMENLVPSWYRFYRRTDRG